MASILNVDKVRATGSTTDGLTVDSNGIVDIPNTKIYALFGNNAVTTNAVITDGRFDTGITAANRFETRCHASGVWTLPQHRCLQVLLRQYKKHLAVTIIHAAMLKNLG